MSVIAQLRARLSGETASASIKGVLWTGGSFVAARCLQLISNVILTRLLFPEAFGLMALCMVVMVGISHFSDIGIHVAVVRHKDGKDMRFLNTVWTVQIIRGFLLWAAIAALAWPVSKVYAEPQLFPLLLAVGATSAISGFGSLTPIVFSRDLNVARAKIIQIAAQFMTLIVTVALAWQFRSVWSLAIGTITGTVIRISLGHIFFKGYDYRLGLHREYLGEFLRSGSWIFLGTIMSFLQGEGIKGIQGYLVSLETMAMIALASTMSMMPRQFLYSIIRGIAFPTISRHAREDIDAYRRSVKLTQRLLMSLMIAMALVLMILSQWIIDILYDERYAQAGAILRILTINILANGITAVYEEALLAGGYFRHNFFFLTAKAVCLIGGTIGGHLMAGLNGMLLGIGFGGFLAYFAMVIILVRKRMWAWGTDLVMLSLWVLSLYVFYANWGLNQAAPAAGAS